MTQHMTTFLQMAPLFLLFLTILASAEPRLVRQNQSDLVSAMADMRRQSYDGFVILLHLLNNTDFLKSTEITFLMPSDSDLSQADLTEENLETFLLGHTIPAWLMINHMLRFPNKTLIPSSITGKMFTITKSGGSGIFVNNARIVSPNICQNSRISCHGISNVIAEDLPLTRSKPSLYKKNGGKTLLPVKGKIRV